MPKAAVILLSFAAVPLLSQQPAATPESYLRLMDQARRHATAHGSRVPPVLSPKDTGILDGSIPVAQLHAAGFRIVPWTTNDPSKMHDLIRLGVDGIISDRPDLLYSVVAEIRRSHTLTVDDASRLAVFDIAGHRGARGLRPENTLPAFEAGLDNLITTIETDTGVTADHKSLISHDQFLTPSSCRRADGRPYTKSDRVYIRDISLHDAQQTFICDKLHGQTFPDQRNDLALSPVASAFARQQGLRSPYVPTHATQLFQFVRFYSDYYRTGLGRTHPNATERALAAEKVRFNLETKILPDPLPPEALAHMDPDDPAENHTVDPQTFVDTLTGAILSQHMEARCEIQSFDFRTLQLVEEQQHIPTYYLVEDPRLLTTTFVPETLRQVVQP